MKTFEYLMSQDRLSTDDSFVLCDGNAEGFPIMYASRGFVDLFGHGAGACVGRRCGSLVGQPSILAHDPGYRGLARLARMAPEDVERSLDVLTAHTAKEIARMVASPGRTTVVVQLLNRTRAGEVIVCEVGMAAFQHPLFGYFYVGIQHDVTDAIPARELLSAGLHGRHKALIKSREAGMKQRLSAMKAKNGPTSRYLREKAGEMWLIRISQAMESEGVKSGPASRYLRDKAGGTWLNHASEETEAEGACKGQGAPPTPAWGRQLSGRWRGTVSDALGGYEQVMDFSGTRLRVWSLDRILLAEYRFDDRHEPHPFDVRVMWAEEAAPSAAEAAAAQPLPATIRCIARVEGDVLHFCHPYMTSERPQDFDGPGYCLMRRDCPRRGW